MIKAKSNSEGITSLSVLDNVALLNLEGRGLLGKVGVDARIFNVLGQRGINVSIISQGSSERGIGLVIPAEKAEEALEAAEETAKEAVESVAAGADSLVNEATEAVNEAETAVDEALDNL